MIKKILKRSVSETQLVALSEMDRSVLGTKSFHLQYDSLQIGKETNFYGNEISHFITKKIGFIADLKWIIL